MSNCPAYATENALRYYRLIKDQVEEFPNQNVLLSMLNKIGFKQTSVINLFNGIVSIEEIFVRPNSPAVFSNLN